MKTYTYYIYHILGDKIGCTTELETRMRAQGFTEWEILWQQEGDYDHGWIAGDKELELQKQYSYKVDSTHYQIVRERRRLGGIKGGNTRGTQVQGEGNPRYGATLTEETKSKISESLKGHTPWNLGIAIEEETKRKISESLTGVALSEERKKNIGDSLRGKPKPKTKCPKCGNMIANHTFERHLNKKKSCA